MATTLAEVLRRFGPEYICTHALSTRQARAWRAIVACRTPALGGEQWRCDDCGAEAWRWHSCRNRHCPQCQTQARDAWRTARLAELLTVPYCHLVFTLPHEITALAGAHPRWVYDTLMQSAAAVVKAVVAWIEDQAACWLEGLVSLIGLSGLRWTTSMRVQFRVFPDHRLGCRMRAAAYTATRLLNRDRSICE